MAVSVPVQAYFAWRIWIGERRRYGPVHDINAQLAVSRGSYSFLVVAVRVALFERAFRSKAQNDRSQPYWSRSVSLT
jgi:hypothetical protein